MNTYTDHTGLDAIYWEQKGWPGLVERTENQALQFRKIHELKDDVTHE